MVRLPLAAFRMSWMAEEEKGGGGVSADWSSDEWLTSIELLSAVPSGRHKGRARAVPMGTNGARRTPITAALITQRCRSPAAADRQATAPDDQQRPDGNGRSTGNGQMVMSDRLVMAIWLRYISCYRGRGNTKG